MSDKLQNKTIAYNVYSNKLLVPDTTEVELPEIEYLTDTISGAGILGEIDLPTLSQIGSMTTTVSFRSSNSKTIEMLKNSDLEIRWVSDCIDTSTGNTSTVANKAFMKVKLKKFAEGKIAGGAAQDGSYEYEVLAYRRIVDGAEMLNIDKLNNVYKINGIDQISDITKNL